MARRNKRGVPEFLAMGGFAPKKEAIKFSSRDSAVGSDRASPPCSPGQHKPFRVRRDAGGSDTLASFDTLEDAPLGMCGADVAVGVMSFTTVERSCDFTRQDILDPVDILSGLTFRNSHLSAILGPQSVIPVGGIGVTENSIHALLKGFKMYVFGLVYYYDIFPNTKRHVTKFCYQIGANLSDKSELISSFGFCAHWNCADEECVDDRKAWETDVAAGKIQKPFEPPPGAKLFNAPIPVVPSLPTPPAPNKT